MFADNHLSSHSTFLLASPEPALLAAVEPALLAAGARVEVVLSAQAALDSMKAVQSSRPGAAGCDAPRHADGPVAGGHAG